MADTDTSRTSSPQQETYEGSERRSQSSFDSSFASMLGNQSALDTSQWVQAYFEQADQTIRTARRVAELHVFSQMKRDIIQEACSLVISELRRNPELLSQSQQQSRSS